MSGIKPTRWEQNASEHSDIKQELAAMRVKLNGLLWGAAIMGGLLLTNIIVVVFKGGA